MSIYYYILVAITASVVILFIAGVIAVVRARKCDASISEEEKQLVGEVEAEREARKNEFRRIYGLPDEVPVYSFRDFYATSPIVPTDHEYKIASSIVDAKYFNGYFVFLDYYFRTSKGVTVQIDVLAVSKRGIFVFESKDYTGWIYGNSNHKNWTEVRYNKKYHFYNPIKQNASHINRLKDILGNRPRFYSVVVFGEQAVLKEVDSIPKNTYVVSDGRLMDAIGDIMEKWPEQYTPAEVLAICKTLNKNRLYCNNELIKEHVEMIEEDVTGKGRLYV